MKRNYTQLVLRVLVFVCMLGSISCKCSHKNENLNNATTQAEIKDSIPFPGVVFLMPTPSEVLFATLDNDVIFIPNLTAPKGIEDKLVSSHQQAILLGVYLTDLSYTIILKNHQESLSYINAIQNLSQKLGIGSVLYDRFLHRIESNFSSIDSMDIIFDDFSQNSYSVIENLGNNELLSLVAMGSGIEAMFLGYKSLGAKEINSIVKSKFIGQSVIYENYYKNFKNYNYRNSDLNRFMNDVDIIYSIFKRNNSLNGKIEVSKVENSQFIIKSAPNSKPYDERNIKELGDSIVIVRNNLIELKYQ